MFAVVIFATHPNFYIILAFVIILAASMFTPLKFIHPVRTKRWRLISLPVALIWTALAGICAWTNFQAGPIITSALAVTSIYLLAAGILQQIFPSKSA